MQFVLLIRGVLKGEPAITLAAELGLNYQTVLTLRHDLISPDFIAALVTGHTFTHEPWIFMKHIAYLLFKAGGYAEPFSCETAE